MITHIHPSLTTKYLQHLLTLPLYTTSFEQWVGINLEDTVDEIDNTVHKSGSGILYRQNADSSTESGSSCNENINDIVHSINNNDKTNYGNNNGDSTGNNDDNDDNGILESGAVCVDEQPHVIIVNDELDA